MPLGENEQVGQLLGETHAMAICIRDQRRVGRALAYQAQVQSNLGAYARAIAAANGACKIAEEVDDLGLRVVANYYLSLVHWWAGDPRQATKPARTLIDLQRGAAPNERFGLSGLPAVFGRFHLALILADLGEFAEALAVGNEGVRIAQTVGHAYSEIWARFGLGYAQFRYGDFAASIQTLKPGLSLCRTLEIRFSLAHIAELMGAAYLGWGRSYDSVPLLDEAEAHFEEMRNSGASLRSHLFRTDACLMLGRISEARDFAQSTVVRIRTHQLKGLESWALKTLGDVHAQSPTEAKDAENAYRQAIAIASLLGLKPLIAHSHLGLAKLNTRIGNKQAADDHHAAATHPYREMDMPFWLERSQQELSELSQWSKDL